MTYSGVMSCLFVLTLGQAPPTTFPELVTTVGLATAIAVFMIWETRNRELRLVKRLEATEDFVKTRMLKAINRNTLALVTVTHHEHCKCDACLILQRELHDELEQPTHKENEAK